MKPKKKLKPFSDLANKMSPESRKRAEKKTKRLLNKLKMSDVQKACEYITRNIACCSENGINFFTNTGNDLNPHDARWMLHDIAEGRPIRHRRLWDAERSKK